MTASAPPILWAIVEFIRERKVDAISILVLGGIALSLLAFAGGGGVKVLQLRENLVAGLVGLVFLGSAAIGRPLIYQLARAGVRRRSADRGAAFEALRSDIRFRNAMTVATLVWGTGAGGGVRPELRPGVPRLDQAVPADQRADRLRSHRPADRLDLLVCAPAEEPGRGPRRRWSSGQIRR